MKSHIYFDPVLFTCNETNPEEKIQRMWQDSLFHFITQHWKPDLKNTTTKNHQCFISLNRQLFLSFSKHPTIVRSLVRHYHCLFYLFSWNSKWWFILLTRQSLVCQMIISFTSKTNSVLKSEQISDIYFRRKHGMRLWYSPSTMEL